MSSLAAPRSVPLRRLGVCRPLALLALLSPLVPAAAAQSLPSHVEDAASTPAGMLRLRVTNAWSRWDQRFASDGQLTPDGAALSTDALGPRQLPRLAPIEAGLQTLTNNPATRLTLGQLAVHSDARVVSIPIALEYGVTSRLSVGVVVPIVQTRRAVRLDVNRDTLLRANMGLVPLSQRGNAAAANLAVANAFQQAAADLAALIAMCRQNPAAAGCAPVTANPADAAAAQARAQSFANAVRTLGVDATTAIVAPRDTLSARIDAQRVALNTRLQQYLGAGAGASTSIFAAPNAFAYFDLQGRNGTPGLLQSSLGGGIDSIRTTERLRLGDVGVGAQLLVFDGFQHDTLPPMRVQSRLAVGAIVRFATSTADSARNLVDIPTGEGAGVELRSALDLISGRFGGTIAARYVKSFARTVEAPLLGDPEAPWPYPLFGPRQRRAGDVVGLDVTPRYFFTDWLAMDGHYGLERVGATTWDSGADHSVVDPCIGCIAPAAPPAGVARTAQRVGLGLRYSTVDAYARRQASFPIEVSLTHLETVRGDAGLPKDARDQIQVRVFYQLLRR